MFLNGKRILNIQPLFKNVKNTFTYEFWVKPLASITIANESSVGISGTQGQKFVIGPGHGESIESAGLGVSVGTNGVIVFEHSEYHFPALLVYHTSITEWTHIAIVMKNKIPHLFINGELKKKGFTSTKKNVYPSGLVGGLNSYGYYKGLLSDVRIWNIERSSSDISGNINKKITKKEHGLIYSLLPQSDSIPQIQRNNKVLQKNDLFKNNLKVLFVKSGNGAPYTALEESIIHSLKQIVKEVWIATPNDDMSKIAMIMKPDLALFFTSGFNLRCDQVERMKKMGVRTALWLTDDPYYIDITKRYVSNFDVVFTQELNCVHIYQTHGAKKVYYLPLAADPNIFHPKSVSANYQSDILFIGNAFWNRVNLFDSIARYLLHKNVKILGLYWDRLKNYQLLQQKIINTWASPEETASYYNGAKIVINMHRAHDDLTINYNKRKIKAISINPRTFEISACKAFQLTDIRQGLSNGYLPGQEVATYGSPQELMEKIDYYLSNSKERELFASRAFKRTLDQHTFMKRISELLKNVFR
ncbi:glycosyltransferase family protein [Metabacillus arenae]|uniref:Glycosyltransferase n=1 Tax=Metabacillus arenae TaxID=2771434 RepID=A0A926NEI5_9BACI|nr:DUF3880 domain-containing protein [Metabacillus arenae]MBD1378988.1 glycosyltransferase [Metabacillus arenae]